MKALKKILLLLFGLCMVSLMAISGSKLLEYYNESRAGQAATDELVEQGVQTSEVPAADEAPLDVDFSRLCSEYPDIAAWLYSEDTPINYPVMQAKDNSYYLKRLPDGSRNRNGSLFIDCANANDFSDLNTIIYGHNMKDGSMFGTLDEYAGQDYYEAHKVIWLLTPNGKYKLRPVAGYVTGADSEAYAIHYDSEELYTSLKAALSQSRFDSGADILNISRIVTLSTCAYDFDDARFVLVCSLDAK